MIKTAVAVINDFSGGQDTRTPIISMGLNKSPNMRNFHCAGVKERLLKRGGYSKINSSAVTSDNLDVYYSCGYQTYDYALRDDAIRTQISQGFKPKTSSTVTKVRLWLKKTGTPAGTDTVTLVIQTDSAGVPSGTAVTNGTSTAVDISDTITTSYAWVTFTFSTNPSLTAGTQYHLVLQGAFTISSVNYVIWGVDNYDVVYGDGSMSIGNGILVTQSQTTNNNDGTLAPTEYWAQGFKVSTTDAITKITFQIKKVTSSGDGTLTGYIYSDANGDPNAAVATFTNMAVSTLTTVYADYDFTGTFTPVVGTQYHAVIVRTGGTVGNLNIASNTAGGYGNGVAKYNNGSWITYGANDWYFKVWQDTTPVWTTEPLYDACFEVYITGGASGDDGVALYDFGSKNMLLGIFGTTVKKMDKNSSGTPDGTWDDLAGGIISSSRFWSFADWQSGRALINTDVGLYTYTGTGSITTVSAAPIGKFIVIYKNYVFMAGIRNLNNTIRYADLSDYTTWTATNTLNVNTNDGDVITGIRLLKGKLYIFKRYSIHRVSYLGSNPTFQVDQILGIGCPSHYAIKEVELGGDAGTVLIFPTTDKKLAIFDGYNVQIIHDSLTEETNDLFASSDDQPLSFADINFAYSDLFHAAVKTDTSEYILYCVLGSDTSINYAFVFDYKTGGIYPYDGQIFSSSCYAVSTNKAKILYCAGYSGYMWQMESGNSDDGSAINAYWVSGKIKSTLASLLNKALDLGIHLKEVSSGSTLNLNFQYRLDWNTAWTTAETVNYDRNDTYAFGKTAVFNIGTIENMLQVKLKDSSTNPAITIYGVDLYGQSLGRDTGDRATS